MHHTHGDPEAQQQVFRSNIDLTETQAERIKTLSGGENVLFAIAADLSMEGNYSDTLFFATEKAVYSCVTAGEEVSRLLYTEIESADVKRCYGNALLTIRKRDGKTENFIRFSLKTASVFEAAALFVARAADGEAFDALLPALEETFEKQRSVCPKCGRSLIRPGAECIYCSSKRRFIKKIGHYILPHKWLLLFCILLCLGHDTGSLRMGLREPAVALLGSLGHLALGLLSSLDLTGQGLLAVIHHLDDARPHHLGKDDIDNEEGDARRDELCHVRHEQLHARVLLGKRDCGRTEVKDGCTRHSLQDACLGLCHCFSPTA